MEASSGGEGGKGFFAAAPLVDEGVGGWVSGWVGEL